jgi:hypothetical protein
MLASTWGENNYMRFLQTHSTLSHQQVNIVFTKDNIHTLIDIVIADPTQVNLLPQSCTTQGFVTSNATEAKK